MSTDIEDKLSYLEMQIKKNDFREDWKDSGIVQIVGDGVATITGLIDVKAGELIKFENGVLGLALNLEEHSVGAVIFGDSSDVKQGTVVQRTGKIASVNVSEKLLGRVIDAFGNPIDGKGKINGEGDVFYEMPLERKAPNVLYRQPVNEPLETGITAIDSMIPIGRGQRELIIGDRQTGKTSIAIDTIINQKRHYDEGNPIYCIYVAVGQKQSTIKSIYSELEKHDALKYTVIVASSASDTASLQYYSPFTGTAIGEFFRDTGRSALIIYDDLSKHAVAYRELSLLLGRPPGREAFPGDIFYLHSRLLERSARINLNDKIAKEMNDLPVSLGSVVKGGGSLTALPIIETKDGDVSAYIPTNVISITDGQIFLETNLFNSGFRPAINVGVSVSRVGSSAQNKPMKSIAGKLKLSQAQFDEIESYSQFASDLDSDTQDVIDTGRRNKEILVQGLHELLTVGEQCSIIYASTNKYINGVVLKDVKKFKEEFIKMMNLKNKTLLDELTSGRWDKDIENKLKKICENFKSNF